MGARRLRLAAPAVALAALASAGCYSYVAVPADGVLPGEEVRAHLRSGLEDSASGSDALLDGGSWIEGELLSASGGRLVLYVPAGTRQVGFHTQRLNQRVQVPRASLLTLERRVLDRGRTAVLMGAGAVGVGLLVWKALGGDAGANTSTPPGNEPSQARVFAPSLSIPVGLPRH